MPRLYEPILTLRGAILVALFLSHLPYFVASAGELTIPEVGISLNVPAGWVHDAGDTRAFVIKPFGDAERVKMKIHRVGYKDISLREAIIKGLEKLNKTPSKKHSPNTLESSESITTKSGLQGLKAVIGPGEFYINKYYFTHPAGERFCICVYKNANMPNFEKECETIILETLKVAVP